MKFITIAMLAGILVGCSGSSPTAPTPQYPNVAGTYTGGITLAYPTLGRTLTCPASTAVTQTGARVSMAPLNLSGVCGVLSIPIGDGEIDSNGSIGNASGTTMEACGLYTYTASGGFFGREFRFSMIYTSPTCVPFNLNGVLTR